MITQHSIRPANDATRMSNDSTSGSSSAHALKLWCGHASRDTTLPARLAFPDFVDHLLDGSNDGRGIVERRLMRSCRGDHRARVPRQGQQARLRAQ